jgi:hypothetical protein
MRIKPPEVAAFKTQDLETGLGFVVLHNEDAP